MHKLTGRFDTKTFSLMLSLNKNDTTSKELFNIIESYYTNNMFIQYARRAPNFQRIVISSIGDHLNNDDEQDVSKADLFLDIEVMDKVSKNLSDILHKAPNWLVIVQLINNKVIEKEFSILIRKSDSFIIRLGDY